MSHLTEILALLIVLGLAAQWLGWRYKIPIILLLVICGLLAGPLLGLIRPSVDLGEAFQPLVRLAVVVMGVIDHANRVRLLAMEQTLQARPPAYGCKKECEPDSGGR
jgi:NhaP-type Na+/H+ or K+/H+ antiporter